MAYRPGRGLDKEAVAELPYHINCLVLRAHKSSNPTPGELYFSGCLRQ